MSTRRTVIALALPLLVLGACAQTSSPGAPSARRMAADSSPAGRFAFTVEGADETMEQAIGRMDAFERLAAREDAAIEYAAGGRGAPARFTPPGAGVAEAAGRTLAPAFTALGDYGHVLTQLAAGESVVARPGPSGTDLAKAAAEALEAVRATAGVTPSAPVREAGLRAMAWLADLPETLAKAGGTPTLQGVVSEAHPQLVALSDLLQDVVGATPEAGVRRAIRARRLSLNEAQGRFLALVRADRGVSAAERYAIFRTVSELREGDPAPGTLEQVHVLLQAMEAAHGALAAAQADASAKVTGFEAAVERLSSLTQLSRRGEQ